MDLSQFDPPDTSEYLSLLGNTLLAFPTVDSHEELVAALGRSRVSDISELPFSKAMNAENPLPPGFSTRVYLFKDGQGRRGFLQADFHGSILVNANIQLILNGWFAASKARRFFAETLIPAMEVMFGRAVEAFDSHSVFRWRGLVVVSRYAPGTPTVSTYLTHEAYY